MKTKTLKVTYSAPKQFYHPASPSAILEPPIPGFKRNRSECNRGCGPFEDSFPGSYNCFPVGAIFF